MKICTDIYFAIVTARAHQFSHFIAQIHIIGVLVGGQIAQKQVVRFIRVGSQIVKRFCTVVETEELKIGVSHRFPIVGIGLAFENFSESHLQGVEKSPDFVVHRLYQGFKIFLWFLVDVLHSARQLRVRVQFARN